MSRRLREQQVLCCPNCSESYLAHATAVLTSSKSTASGSPTRNGSNFSSGASVPEIGTSDPIGCTSVSESSYLRNQSFLVLSSQGQNSSLSCLCRVARHCHSTVACQDLLCPWHQSRTKKLQKQHITLYYAIHTLLHYMKTILFHVLRYPTIRGILRYYPLLCRIYDIMRHYSAISY